MSSRIQPRCWTVADQISVAVVLGAAAIVGLGLQSGTFGPVREDALQQMTAALAAEAGGCDEACGRSLLGISGDPAVGAPYPH
jgi:hypothetical protein